MKKDSGFIALFSVIIISFVLLLAATTLSFSGFFGRFNILDSEMKAASEALADACLEEARLILVADKTSIGSNTRNIGSGTCSYEISAGGEIKSSSVVKGAYTYYKIEVDLTEEDMPIIYFEECVNVCS